jgi:hypothetical protein
VIQGAQEPLRALAYLGDHPAAGLQTVHPVPTPAGPQDLTPPELRITVVPRAPRRVLAFSPPPSRPLGPMDPMRSLSAPQVSLYPAEKQ